MGFIRGFVLLFILPSASKNSVSASSSCLPGVQPDEAGPAFNWKAGLLDFIQAYTFMHFES